MRQYAGPCQTPASPSAPQRPCLSLLLKMRQLRTKELLSLPPPPPPSLPEWRPAPGAWARPQQEWRDRTSGSTLGLQLGGSQRLEEPLPSQTKTKATGNWDFEGPWSRQRQGDGNCCRPVPGDAVGVQKPSSTVSSHHPRTGLGPQLERTGSPGSSGPPLLCVSLLS